MAPKTLTTTVVYRFRDGSIRQFHGKRRWRLSNSWRDALDGIQRACRQRGEPFDIGRTAAPN
jgi:ribosomal protein L16 Arg81 hydroxylase